MKQKNKIEHNRQKVVTHGETKRGIRIYAAFALMAFAAVFALYFFRAQDCPAPPKAVETGISAVNNRKAPTIPSGQIMPKPESEPQSVEIARVKTAPEPTAPPSSEPSPEAERHYQKTRIFMAEAKESLPVIDIRAFNAMEAEAQSGPRGNGNANSAPHRELRDGKGLRNGEIWLRISAGSASRYSEVMAQTADLYRANTGYSGDVQVLLWVKGQVIAKESYEYKE